MADYQHPISCDSEIVNLGGGQNTLNKHHMSRMSLVGYSKAVLLEFFYPVFQCNEDIPYTFIEMPPFVRVGLECGRCPLIQKA